MSFKTNDCQQLSFDDSFITLTERERKALEKSWAKIFADEIFPAIDEERFSVLYSDKASRPNAPVNVIIGALIIKELFDYSDDEIVENLMLDLHLQYALHTTSFVEQPISDKTLTRFRKRCYDYETLHGVDLYHDCVKDLSGKIAKIMKLNGRIRRMDSIMIESNIRFLSRMELIYTCISKLVVYLTKKQPDMVSEPLKHYADPNDYNRIFYHQRNDDMETTIQTLLTDSDCLLELCKTDFEETTEYQLFVRCLSDQTVVENDKRRLRTKEDGTMNSLALQSPSDPDATYRNKSGKHYRGYTANIEETVGKNGSVVTNYQFDRYCTLLAGITKMLKSVGYKLHIEYIQQERGQPGYVELSAVPIVDYSERLELSQDSRLNFVFDETKNGVNHLICLGKGELQERQVIDLYVQEDGSIGTTQYYTGIQEVVETYEDTSSESDELEEKGREKLQELMNSTSFSMDVESLDMDVEIGDIIGGRDYVTGMYAAKPIAKKIYKVEGGKTSLEYEIEGDDS